MKNLNSIEQAWKEKLIKDLGLETYNSLFKNTLEDIIISPFYTNNNKTKNLAYKFLFPHQWNILVEINSENINVVKNELNNYIENDIKHIILEQNLDVNYKEILKKYSNNDLKIYIQSVNIKKMNECTDDRISFIIDQKTEIHKIEDLKNIVTDKFRININSGEFKNKGSNIIQEIAFSLALGNEYLQTYGSKVSKNISFELTQGGNYFFEISKIQVVRILWALITKEYGNQVDDCIITAKPSLRNKTIKNYNNNLIRSTSECMSGILGGCDFIKSIPYDTLFKEKNKFSQRIMNNQLLILKNETYLDKVCNAIEGSYYVSELIQVIAEKSLLLFKKIEKKGGYIESFNSGYISNQIKNNSDSEKLLYELNKKVLVGFNKYNEGLEFSSNKELLKSKKIIESLKHNIDRIAKSELN